MGLDGVELILDVEDHFGVTIRDSEAPELRTAGDLVTLLQNRIAAAQTDSCAMLGAFRPVCVMVREVADDDNYRLRPRDKVVHLLSPRMRVQFWRRLPDLLGCPPRELRRPKLLRRALFTGAVALLGLATVGAFAIDAQILPLSLAVAAVSVLLLHVSTLPFRTSPPEDWTTLGDITRKVVGVSRATKRIHLRSEEQILKELRPLIASTLGVDPDEVTPKARFVEDLGIG